MNGLDLINQPITTKDYQIYDISALPKIFLGIKVKNKLDEKRLKIKNIYKPKLVSHFMTHTQLEPIFFYGIEISLKGRYNKLLHLLNNKIYLENCSYEKMLQTYRILLASYNLSCHTCYSYLADGLYPIDVKYLDIVSRKDFSRELETGFSCMIKKASKASSPWYCNINNFNLFVLGKSTGYSSDFILNTRQRNIK